VIGQAIVTQIPANTAGLPMAPKQAYAGLLGQNQTVDPNTVLVIFPPAPGNFGTIQVEFQNGSDPVTLDVGYGQPLAVFPADGRIVSTVTLVSGTLYYYTSTPDLARAFLSAAASPGGGTAPPATSGTLQFAYNSSGTQSFSISPGPGFRWRLWGFGLLLKVTGSGGLTVSNLAFNLYYTANSLGSSWGKSESSITDLASGSTVGFAVLPSGANDITGSYTASDFMAVLNSEYAVEPGMALQITVTGLGVSGPVNTTFTVQPFGIQETL
jgi:hypothetical protein